MRLKTGEPDVCVCESEREQANKNTENKKLLLLSGPLWKVKCNKEAIKNKIIKRIKIYVW